MKKELIEAINKYGGQRCHSAQFQNKAHHYRSSLIARFTQEKVPVAQIDSFIKAYAKLLDVPAMPVLKIPTALVLYKMWRIQPLVTINMQKALGEVQWESTSNEIWDCILTNCLKHYIFEYMHFVIIFRLSKIIRLSDASVINHVLYLDCIEKVAIQYNYIILKEKPDDVRKKINAVLNCYEELMLIMESRQMNDPYKAHVIINLVRNIIRKRTVSDHSIYRVAFLDFFTILADILAPEILMQGSENAFLVAFTFYTYNPDLFSRQKTMIDSSNVIPSPSNECIVLKNILKDYNFPAIFYNRALIQCISEQEKEWMIYLIKGNSIRKIPGLPFKLPKNAAHYLMQMHKELNQKKSRELVAFHSILNILLYASFRANGMPHTYALEILNTNIRNRSYDLNRWIDQFTILYKKRLPKTRINEVADYLIFRDSNVDLKNKTIENLLADVEEWHEDIQNQKFQEIHRHIKFKDIGLEKFEHFKNNRNYTILQLLTPFELYTEGRALRHCVFSYMQFCATGKCAIFSLQEIDNTKQTNRLLTIEVVDGRIVQARGLRNRTYNELEYGILTLWAEKVNVNCAV